LASKRGYSSGVGATDLAHMWAAFEELNTCTLSLSMALEMRYGRPDLRIIVSASTKSTADVEPAPLGSSDFSLSSQGFVTLDSAIMFALYQIDFQLAASELGDQKAT